MPKVLTGKVVSIAMRSTAVVEVVRKKPHPLYKKLLTRSKKYKVETGGKMLAIGDVVDIVETRPQAKDKHFTLVEKKEKTK